MSFDLTNNKKIKELYAGDYKKCWEQKLLLASTNNLCWCFNKRRSSIFILVLSTLYYILSL